MLAKHLLFALAAATTITASPISRASRDREVQRRTPFFDSIDTKTNTNNKQHDDAGNSVVGSIHGGGNAIGSQTISCRRSLIQARADLHSAYSKRKMDFDTYFDHFTASTVSSGGDQNVILDNHSTNNSGNTVNKVDHSNKQDFSKASNLEGAGIRCRRSLEALQVERRHLALGDAVLNTFGVRDASHSRNPLAARDIGAMADDLQVYVRSNGAIACQGGVCPSELHRREAEEMLLQHARHLGFAV